MHLLIQTMFYHVKARKNQKLKRRSRMTFLQRILMLRTMRMRMKSRTCSEFSETIRIKIQYYQSIFDLFFN